MDTNEKTIENEVPAVEPVTGADSSNRLAAARRFAMEQYQRIRRAAGSRLDDVCEYTKNARRQINDGWSVTCSKARDLHEAGEHYVRKNPTSSVLGALGVGLILGLLLGRGSR
ncbi:MAG TPA: DUF883 family protein [Candidatus Akkermansia intestinavium]|nr:DUF883 family protein [Candidatus Akkermansia intestinavium]